MLKDNWKSITRIARLADNGIIVSTFFISYALRDFIIILFKRIGIRPEYQLRNLSSIDRYFIVLGIALFIFNAALSIFGAYRSMRFASITNIIKVSFLSSVLVFISAGAILFLLKLDLSRSLIAIFCSMTALCLIAERVSVLSMLRYFRIKGKNFRNILVVGTGAVARKVARDLDEHPEFGVKVFALVDLEPNSDVAKKGSGSLSQSSDCEVLDPEGFKIITLEPSSFEFELKKHAIDEVFFTEISEKFHLIKEIAQISSEEGIRVTIVADIFSLGLRNSEVSFLGNLPLIHYESFSADEMALIAKRLFDFVFSLFALIVLSPLFLVVACLVYIDSGPPIIFKQKRVGLNGRIFQLYKFRSMIKKAESELSKLKYLNEMKGPAFKLENDPRVTRVGRFIRKYSLDELPQLFNVLMGEMSLVGPRPPLPDEVLLYERHQRRRLSMRPGMTCTWQVSGRNQIIDFREWSKMDLAYIDTWSFWKDIALLIKTIPVVFRGYGAK